eukprot:scaffold1962_cov180-Ochromonas_danica.AAC.1
MSSLADDLLRSRSLGDLRELVYTLQVEADGKKSELQSMVGSQYQEFIQSADRIALMQKQSQEVLEMLSLLEKFTEAAIGNVGVLMEKPPPPPATSATSATPPPPPPAPANSTTTIPTLSVNVTCAEVWKALQNMRVMDAAVASLHAHLLLLHPHPLPSSPAPTTSMAHYLLPTTQAILSRQKVTEKEREQLQGVSFLLPAVGQDARLLILAPHSSTTTTTTTTTTLPQRAEAFAVFALLGERSLSEAVAVARLQQVALLTSLSLPPEGSSSSSSSSSTLYQPLYREGCAHLLRGGESLWQRALAKVFLRGVEQLLCRACEEVLLQSTHLLLHQLRDLGLVVRLKSSLLSSRNGSRQQQQQGVEEKEEEEEEEDMVVAIESIHFPPPPPPPATNSSSTTLSSSVLFLKAEQISQSFDRAVGSLLDEVIKPVRPSSSSSTFSSCYYYCYC